MFTCAIVTGLTEASYHGRYCFESPAEALASLAQWDGHGDPGGNWLKYKGSGGERMGPGLAADPFGEAKRAASARRAVDHTDKQADERDARAKRRPTAR